MWRSSGTRGSAPPIRIPSFSSMRSTRPGRRGSTPTTASAAPRRADPNSTPAWTISATGDVLTVWKLDRLGRNTQHVLAVVDQLTSRGIGFRSLTEGLHTDGPMGKAMLTIMAAFAQLERDTMIERTRAGLARRRRQRAQGRTSPQDRRRRRRQSAQLREKGIAATDIAKMLGVSRATVYRYLADDTAA